jgi:ATP-binding cassette, subfamily B, bacterial PglK
MMQLFKKIDIFLTRRDKLYIVFLFLLSLLVSLLEIVSISSLMPFVALSSKPSLLGTNRYFIWANEYLHIDYSKDFIIIFGITLLLLYIFRFVINIYYLYLFNIFAGKKHFHIKKQIYLSYVQLYYQDFVKNNSGLMIKNIMSETGYIPQMITTSLLLFSEGFIFIILYGILFATDWKITIVTSIAIGTMVLIISKVSKQKIAESGQLKSELNGNQAQMINETFGNYKIIKMTGNENIAVCMFALIVEKLTSVAARYTFVIGLPRFLLETAGFVAIVGIVIYVFSTYEDSSAVFPVLAMFALAFYRMLPSITKILAGVNQIRYFMPSINILYDELTKKTEVLGEKVIKFNNKIELTNVSFEFEKNRTVLDRVNLRIGRGQKVAFVGESGSGKSTLVDLITGIYQPDSGEVRIDGQLLTTDSVKSWRRKIGYIPQSIYLFDGTVAENVIFYRPPDEEKLIQVLKKASIYDFLQTKEGLNTNVGDGGIQLSGGQKQRIAIARALYSDPDILILDEATSALDDTTEKKIMEEIYQVSAGKTLIVIAHRLSTIQKCEVKYKMNQGHIQMVKKIA